MDFASVLMVTDNGGVSDDILAIMLINIGQLGSDRTLN